MMDQPFNYHNEHDDPPLRFVVTLTDWGFTGKNDPTLRDKAWLEAAEIAREKLNLRPMTMLGTEEVKRELDILRKGR